MKKTGVFYGSTTGTTESVATLIAEKLGITTNTVKKHINNANHFLKKKLSKSIFSLISITPNIFFYVFI